MTAPTNQRWYTDQGSLSFVRTDSPGEVRVSIVDVDGGKGYIMAGSPGPSVEQSQWISNQLNGVLDNEQYAEDFSWVQEMIDELLVPDERCRVAWGACRGTVKDPTRGDLQDVVAIVIAADLFNDPQEPETHFRIATFPLAPWDGRRMVVEEGLRAMALQRYARESLVAESAKRYPERAVLPLPGLRLTRQITPYRSPEDEAEWAKHYGKQDKWDLTSARGGLDYRFEERE